MSLIKDIKFKSPPIMFAAWPDMGNVGIIAIDYLRKQLPMKFLAQIDLGDSIVQDSVIVKDGVVKSPRVPECKFFYCNNPDVIIFESDIQLNGKEGSFLIQILLDVAVKLKVKYIFTATALAKSMSYSDKSDVACISNNSWTRDYFKQFGIKPLPSGEISGLSGILLGTAAQNNINAGCFVGTVPAYAYSWVLSYPKASLEIMKIISSMLGVSLDYTEFNEDVGPINSLLATIEKQINAAMGGQKKEEKKEVDLLPKTPHISQIPEIPEIPLSAKKPDIPKAATHKIEHLFRLVQHDKSKAMVLKKELDHWHLFKKYERRFLNLFK